TLVSDWAVGPDGGLYYCKQFSNPSIRRIVYTANPAAVGEPNGFRPPVLSVSPNPYSPGRGAVNIEFRSDAPGPVEIGVFDLAGRKVAAIPAEAGSGSSQVITWNAAGADGNPLRPGMYFLKIRGRNVDGSARLVISGH